MREYKVTMRQGNDSCTTETTIKANTVEDARLKAEMTWSDIRVKVEDVRPN